MPDRWFFSLLSTDARAQFIEACVSQNNGNVNIVAANQACGNKETRVVWSVAGPAGEPGPPGPAGEPGPAGASLLVVDSTQPEPLEIGYLVDVTKLITTPANEAEWFALSFTSSGFPEANATTAQAIYYVGANCQGEGYLAASSFGRPIIEATVQNGQVVYATEPLAFVAPIAGSIYRFNICTSMEAPFNSFPAAAPARMRPVTDFTLRPGGTLTPPLRVVTQ